MGFVLPAANFLYISLPSFLLALIVARCFLVKEGFVCFAALSLFKVLSTSSWLINLFILAEIYSLAPLPHFFYLNFPFYDCLYSSLFFAQKLPCFYRQYSISIPLMTTVPCFKLSVSFFLPLFFFGRFLTIAEAGLVGVDFLFYAF